MRISLLFSLILSAQFLVAQSSNIIISPIGQQTAYEGSRITVYFSTLKYFESIDFTSPDLPEFGSLTYDQIGNGRFVFDLEEGNEGVYTITLEAQNGNLSNTVAFNLSVLPINETTASIFYIDPATGNDNATGSENDPFATLTSFLATKTALINDNTYIFLKDGFHGEPVFTGTRNSPVKVLAASGHTPRVKRLNFSFTTNWHVSGLDVSPQNDNKVDTETLINVFAGSKYIEITNCNVYAIDDASVWTTNEMWYEGSGNGILSSGTECIFRNNFFKNTWFTVEMRKAYNEFSYNIIDRFGADAIRTLANNQSVNYNQIKNATVYDYDHPTRPQHDDGIQSYTFNNPIKNVEIIGNQIADIADPNLELPTEIMQGIVDFDGFAEDWIVTNNLVITHHAHGIALYGAKNCNVSNNTVTRNPFDYFSPQFKPWIRISPRKVQVGSDRSFGNLVRNNIMSSYQDEGLEPATADHNLITLAYETIYADYINWDFHLSATSEAIDGGKASSTPNLDQENKLRNIGAPDIGCFEKDATLTDREAPSSPSNVQFTSGQTDILLTWDESTDNTGVSHYEISIDNNIIYTSITNSIQITRLDPEKEYSLEIIAVDDFGNQSAEASTTATTSTEEFMTVHYVPSHRHDQLVKSNTKLMWVGMQSLQIGDYENGEDAAAVVPFQLPCIDNERTIVSADVLLNVETVEGSPTGSIDMYFVEMRAKSDVLGTDYYSGPSEDVITGTIIAEDLVDNNSNGLTSLTSDQQSVLGIELNELYDAGACNKFAFMRFNSNVTNEPTNSYYTISSFDNENSDHRPLLRIISNSTTSVINQEILGGIKITPNPILGNEIVIAITDEFTSSRFSLEVHNSQGQKVFSKLISDSANRIQVTADLIPGMYYVTILGKEKYAQTKLIKL